MSFSVPFNCLIKCKYVYAKHTHTPCYIVARIENLLIALKTILNVHFEKLRQCGNFHFQLFSHLLIFFLFDILTRLRHVVTAAKVLKINGKGFKKLNKKSWLKYSLVAYGDTCSHTLCTRIGAGIYI